MVNKVMTVMIMSSFVWRRQRKAPLIFFLFQSFVVMAENGMCSLEKAVETRWLGNSIDNYIECLERIASVIATLHARGLVLCDFSADMIYIEKDSTSEHLKNVRLPLVSFHNQRFYYYNYINELNEIE